MRTIMFNVAAAIAFGFVAAPASHAETVRAERISYADLDLSSEADARELLLRIRGAAFWVCSDHLNPMPFVQACMRETVQQTVATAHLPRLTTVYEDAIGRRQHARAGSQGR